jgi:hypothetical protein
MVFDSGDVDGRGKVTDCQEVQHSCPHRLDVGSQFPGQLRQTGVQVVSPLLVWIEEPDNGLRGALV